MRILVVVDEPSVREVLERILERDGFEVELDPASHKVRRGPASSSLEVYVGYLRRRTEAASVLMGMVVTAVCPDAPRSYGSTRPRRIA